MTKAAVPALLLVLAGGWIASAEEVDLIALFDVKPRVGEAYRHEAVEWSRYKQVVGQGKNLLMDSESAEGFSAKRRVKVLALTKKGAVTKLELRYESFSTKAKEGGRDVRHEVKGLVLTLDVTSGQPVLTEATGKPIPPALQARLMKEGAQLRLEAQGEKKREGPELLLPKGRIKVGSEWTRPVREAAALLEMEGELDEAASRVKGTLARGEREGYLSVTLEVHFVFKSFGGMPCSEPFVVDMTLKGELEASGKVFRSLEQSVDMGGTMLRDGLDVVLKLKGGERERILPPE